MMEAIVSPRTVPGMAQRMRRTKGGMLPRDRGRCARARCISPTLRKDAAFREYQQMWLFVSMMGRSISKLGLGHAVHVVARQMVKSKARGGFCCFAVFFMQLLVSVLLLQLFASLQCTNIFLREKIQVRFLGQLMGLRGEESEDQQHYERESELGRTRR